MLHFNVNIASYSWNNNKQTIKPIKKWHLPRFFTFFVEALGRPHLAEAEVHPLAVPHHHHLPSRPRTAPAARHEGESRVGVLAENAAAGAVGCGLAARGGAFALHCGGWGRRRRRRDWDRGLKDPVRENALSKCKECNHCGWSTLLMNEEKTQSLCPGLAHIERLAWHHDTKDWMRIDWLSCGFKTQRKWCWNVRVENENFEEVSIYLGRGTPTTVTGSHKIDSIHWLVIHEACEKSINLVDWIRRGQHTCKQVYVVDWPPWNALERTA